MNLLTTLLYALPLILLATTRYRSAKLPSGLTRVTKESIPGSGVFDTVVSALPADAVRARIGGKYHVPYSPEGIRQLNFSQFGLNKFFDPGFKFCVSYRPSTMSVSDLMARGQNLFVNFQLTQEERNALPMGAGLLYHGESGLHGPFEGAAYWHASLAEMEQCYQNRGVGAEKGYWCANIETSTEWWPGNEADGPYPGFPRSGNYQTNHYENWNVAKNRTITLESTGEQNVSLETLANRGYGAWVNEKNARRGNRNKVMMIAAQRRSPQGGRVAYGASMYQGDPVNTANNSTSAFSESYATSAAFQANAQGEVSLNGRLYKLEGDQYSSESFHLDYYYAFYFRMELVDYQEIFQQQQPAKVNMPYIWSKIKPIHVVAEQIGHHQANEHRIKNRQGDQNRPVLVQREFFYEANVAGIVEGAGELSPGSVGLIARVPSAMNAGYIDYGDGGTTQDDTPKIWFPPYLSYSYYVIARFFFANRPGSGFFNFNGDSVIDLSVTNGNNFHLHTITAMWQGRHDLQPYEKFLGLSTMIEQPEVQANQTGLYSSYTAIAAFNVNDGVKGPQKPVFLVRYLAEPGGFRVLILGGDIMGYTEERTHNVQFTIPGFSGIIRVAVKLRGPAAQVFEINVKPGDGGQTFSATPIVSAQWERPGYAGKTAAVS